MEKTGPKSILTGSDAERKALREILRNRDAKMACVQTVLNRVAHELNNYVLPVMGYVSLTAEMTEQGSEGHSMAERAGLSVEKLERRLTDLLEACRPKRKSAPRPIELGPLAAAELEVLLARCGGQIQIESKIEPSSFHGDPDLWRRFFRELFTNAVLAQADRPAVWVSVEPVKLGAEWVDCLDLPGPEVLQIQVEDRGKGMSVEVFERCLEPFFKGFSAPNCSGLGLSFAYELVRSHGGQLLVESELGQGTRVTAWLPKRE